MNDGLISPNQTLRQYARARRELFFQENPDTDLTRAEYDRVYPPESRRDMWLRELWEFIRFGGVLSFHACEAICREFGEKALDSMKHDYWECTPAGYLKPSTRKRNQEHERGLAEARTRGRAASQEPTP